jgi:putative transposase
MPYAEARDGTKLHVKDMGSGEPVLLIHGYCESFNSKLRDELLKGEIFYTLEEAKVIIESWRRHYNTVRPHSSLGYRPPAPEVVVHASTLAPRPTLN